MTPKSKPPLRGMKLRDLSKPQWDAALEASRILMQGSPNRDADRAAWREANAKFAAMLPPEANAKELVLEAARWDATNTIAAICAGLPAEARA